METPVESNADAVLSYVQSLMEQGKSIAAEGIATAQKAVWEAMGVGKADAMTPQERMRYEEAVNPEKFQQQEQPQVKPFGGDGSSMKDPTPEQIARALILREQIRRKALQGEPK